MLIRRIVTAVLLVIPIIGVLVLAPGPWVAGVAFALYFMAAWEWSGFLQRRNAVRRALLVLCYAGLMISTLWLLEHAQLMRWLFFAVLVWWVIALVWITRYPTIVPDGLVGLCGVLVLIPPVAVIMFSRVQQPSELLIFVFIIVWAADIGAYFVGRSLGRHKLAPKVSPGKTWEGFFGGMAAAVLAAVGFGLVTGSPALVPLVLMGLLGAAGSVVGDLTVSLFKRHAGVKDSGFIFPGHGGVLDRFDSFSAAAPVVFGLNFSLGYLLV
ncbi:MAG: phosphatidate cytidylyltransferase [Gammaproteobacteria bacterium]|nr:phosphatidate cytidylyltransferase [Gammaproteobacteria bacterium]